MKNKLLDKISSIHTQIEALDKELSSIQVSEIVDRTNKLTIGSKVLLLQELNVKLFSTIEIFLDLDGTVDELPEGAKEYYLKVEELRKPVSDTDTEEIKKINFLIPKVLLCSKILSIKVFSLFLVY